MCISYIACAQGIGLLGIGGSAPVGYQGPLDVYNTGTRGCFSLRACSAALAAIGTTVSARLIRNGDSEYCDILIATSGGLGNTTSCVGGSDNGISASSFCAGASSSSCQVIRVVDQTGTVGPLVTAAGNALSTGNPTIVFTGCTSGSLPCVKFVRASTQYLEQTTTMSTTAQPTSYSVVGVRTASFTSLNGLVSTFDNSTPGQTFLYNNAANQVVLDCGSSLSSGVTASDSTWHAFTAVCNGASSYVSVDGTQTTTGSTGTSSNGNVLLVGIEDLSVDQHLDGMWVETIMWAGNAIPSSTAATLSAKQHTYWGF